MGGYFVMKELHWKIRTYCRLLRDLEMNKQNPENIHFLTVELLQEGAFVAGALSKNADNRTFAPVHGWICQVNQREVSCTTDIDPVMPLAFMALWRSEICTSNNFTHSIDYWIIITFNIHIFTQRDTIMWRVCNYLFLKPGKKPGIFEGKQTKAGGFIHQHLRSLLILLYILPKITHFNWTTLKLFCLIFNFRTTRNTDWILAASSFSVRSWLPLIFTASLRESK